MHSKLARVRLSDLFWWCFILSCKVYWSKDQKKKKKRLG